MGQEREDEARPLPDLERLQQEIADLHRRLDEHERASNRRLRRAESALGDSEERFRALSEAAFEAIAIHEDDVILEANDPFARLFRCERAAAIGRSVLDFAAPESRELVRANILSGFAEPYEATGLRADGTTFLGRLHSRSTTYRGRQVRVTALRDITDERRAEGELRDSEAKNRALLQAIPDLMFRLREDGTFVDYKAARHDRLAVPPEVFLGKQVREVLPDYMAELTMLHIERALATGDTQVYEYPLRVMSEESHDFEARVVVSGKDEVTAIIRDITERKQAEERLRVSLEEKGLLLGEIQHRVKNNLQVISSLLNLQAQSAQDETTRAMFRDAHNRVRAMGLTHEQLYRANELTRIDLGHYLRDLTGSLFRSYGVDPDVITLELDVGDVSLGVDRAIPCGLIVNELVSNSLRHAFPGGRTGRIRIQLRLADDGGITLVVGDDGVGLPTGATSGASESLGLQIVTTLAEQLGGTVDLCSSGGTEARVEFRR